jgi:hypothetical protein
MGKAIEINILFAAQDDTQIVDGRGWVSYFEKFLRMMLQQTSANAFNIRLLPDSEDIDGSLKGIMIAILSPDFILSGICLDRLENFASKQSGNLEKTIFKVHKTALDFVDVPKIIKPLPSYDLFYSDQDNASREFNDFFTKEAEGNYWMKMIDLCFDIYEAILEKTELPHRAINDGHKRKAIYLAETGQDLTGARNIIKRELGRHGFDLYPKSNNLQTLKDWKKAITEDLALCTFSIHLVGASYGRLPKNSEVSIMDLQNDMAASYAEQQADFSRLIWITPSLKYASEKQLAFIHNIKRDSHASAGAEVLQTSLEDFKNTLWEEILEGGLSRKLRRPAKLNVSTEPKVYLVYDIADKEHADPIRKQLADHKIEILEMPIKGELMELRNQHVDNLKEMDGAIVIQDAVNDQWVHMKLLDLLKAPGFGRNQPILGRLMLSSSEEKSRKLYEQKYQVHAALLKDKIGVENFIKELSQKFEAHNVALQAQEE